MRYGGVNYTLSTVYNLIIIPFLITLGRFCARA